MEERQLQPFVLENTIQYYDWGTKNNDAYIPQLIDRTVEKDKPYAELWIGVHPKGPSRVQFGETTLLLDDVIREHPEQILGQQVAETWSRKLPFLLKVLSVSEALSIQTHPTAEQAKILHASDPQNYPDSNHKPELVIALNEVTALIGFRSFDECKNLLTKYPELKKFLKRDFLTKEAYSIDQKQQWIRGLFTRLIKRSTTSPKILAKSLSQLEVRLTNTDGELDAEQRLFLSLRPKYGDDIGLYFIFLLNLVHLEKGQGVFIKPGIPHAYIKGNMIECMANSDNVVRAGLTPKFKDLSMLVSLLTYESGPIDVLDNSTQSKDFVYSVEASEFELQYVAIDGKETCARTCESLTILLVLHGTVRVSWNENEHHSDYAKGTVLLVPAAVREYTLSTTDGHSEIFAATVPTRGRKNV